MNTGLSNINRTAKHGSFAHFPGTGPKGSFCEKCKFFTAEKRKGFGVCGKYTQLMSQKGNQIRGNTAACKYWEAA